MSLTERATCWSITINNPTPADHEAINIARQKGWTIEGQVEKGEQNGVIHFQLMLRTPQVRFSAVKKVFPRAHIEVARNSAALAQYVTKEDTRVSQLQSQSEKYPSLVKFWDLVLADLNDGSKEGLDYFAIEEGKIVFFRESEQKKFEVDPLCYLDRVGKRLIENGYYVEGILCNPAVRSAWKKFAPSIMLRAHKYPQTDRQTDSVQNTEVPVLDSDITNGSQKEDDDSSSQEVD